MKSRRLDVVATALRSRQGRHRRHHRTAPQTGGESGRRSGRRQSGPPGTPRSPPKAPIPGSGTRATGHGHAEDPGGRPDRRRTRDGSSPKRTFKAVLTAKTADLETRALSVRGETKTAKSRRQVLLSDVGVEALRRHADRQGEECRAAGSDWRETGLVLTNTVGASLTTTNVTFRSFRPLLELAGLPLIRFHDLRHTAATLLLGKGIHPKVVSELLGHSQVGLTLDLCSHVTPTMHRQAVTTFDELLRS